MCVWFWLKTDYLSAGLWWGILGRRRAVFVFGPVEGIINQGWPQPAVNHCVPRARVSVCVCECARHPRPWVVVARARVRYSKWTKLIIVKNPTPHFSLCRLLPLQPSGVRAEFNSCALSYTCFVYMYVPYHASLVSCATAAPPSPCNLSNAPSRCSVLQQFASYPYHSGFSLTYKMVQKNEKKKMK